MRIAILAENDKVFVKHAKFSLEADREYPSVLVWALVSADPELGVGEGFMQGRWRMLAGEPEDALSIFWNIATTNRLLPFLRKVINGKRFYKWQANTPELARSNIAHHYDADNTNNALFERMLGSVPCYSSAIFETPTQSLADAQHNKINIVVERLDIRAGDQVLDIGCGWGVLTRRLARAGCNVTGITLSQEQLNYCNRLASADIVGNQDYLLEDYRSFFARVHDRRYDKITCIEVLDHIGKAQYDLFFQLVRSKLKDDGTFFLQLIARPHEGQTSGWIQKYIYPGGYIASINEVTRAFESAGFKAIDLAYIPGIHYANTLREWRKLLRDEWKTLRQDPRLDVVFYRKWMFFLAYSISAFENAGFCNYHLILKKA